MSDKKQTFIDPKTGEEIESTWLALRLADFIDCQFISLAIAAFVGIFFLNRFGFVILKYIPVFIASGVVAWLKIGAISARFISQPHECLLFRGVHDSIARAQHFRRQQLLQRKLAEEEWRGVPDKALSQASLPGNPQPTDFSLARTGQSDEQKPRLAEAVDRKNQTDTEKQLSVI